MYLAILLPTILAFYAIYKHKLTNSAGLFAWLCAFIIAYYGGLYAFYALALTFFLTIISDKIKTTKRDQKRTIYQIISNVLTPTLCIILFHFKNANLFYVMYYAVLSSSLADTLASSIGTLSKEKPLNIFTLKRVNKGDSGAISFLGLNASLMGGIILGLIYLLVDYNINNYILIIIMALAGSLIDSILGATIQGKYKCNVCHNLVENGIHCNKETTLITGFKFVNNDVVNLLNNIFVFLISFRILL